MQYITINIGLLTVEGNAVCVDHALGLLKAVEGLTVTHTAVGLGVWEGNPEATLVASCTTILDEDLLHATLRHISTLLSQSCIAVLDHDTGEGALCWTDGEEIPGIEFDRSCFQIHDSAAPSWSAHRVVPKLEPGERKIIESHCDYLEGTLIPDCVEAGSEGHAEDHTTSARLLRRLLD